MHQTSSLQTHYTHRHNSRPCSRCTGWRQEPPRAAACGGGNRTRRLPASQGRRQAATRMQNVRKTSNRKGRRGSFRGVRQNQRRRRAPKNSNCNEEIHSRRALLPPLCPRARPAEPLASDSPHPNAASAQMQKPVQLSAAGLCACSRLLVLAQPTRRSYTCRQLALAPTPPMAPPRRRQPCMVLLWASPAASRPAPSRPAPTPACASNPPCPTCLPQRPPAGSRQQPAAWRFAAAWPADAAPLPPQPQQQRPSSPSAAQPQLARAYSKSEMVARQ